MKKPRVETTKLNSILDIEYELALSIFQNLHSKPEKRAMLTGSWRYNKKNKTFWLEDLTPEQVTMLDILMCDRLRAISDMVECLDYALETIIAT